MADAATAVVNGADTAWVIVATALVLFMTLPGLALFYGGLVRSKNVLSVFVQCFALTGVMTLLWVAYGYSLAFGNGGAQQWAIGNLDKAFFRGVSVAAVTGTIPEALFAAFQMTFAIITPALIVGAFAERMRFKGMLLFSALWFTLSYLPICHMAWAGEGSLFHGWGVLDFAGGTVVHVNAGIAGLVTHIAAATEFGGSGLAEGMTIGSQVWAQAKSVLVTILWSGVVSAVAFFVVDKLVGMRVPIEVERGGLDLAEHQEQAYEIV